MKKSIALLLALVLTLFLCACDDGTSSNQSSTQESPTAKAPQLTETGSASEADERDAVVTNFLVGLGTKRKDQVDACVPCAEIRNYMYEFMDNMEVTAITAEVTLNGEKGGVPSADGFEEDLNHLKEEYANEVGVILDIAEAYIYSDYSCTFTLTDGRTFTNDGTDFAIFAVKIGGVWYALPGSL